MADGSGEDSGVPQHAGLQLVELNQRSASLGSWDVGIFNPGIERWTYTDKKSKSQKEGAAFRCYRVLLSDPSLYVRGAIGMRNSDLKPPQAAEKKLLRLRESRRGTSRLRGLEALRLSLFGGRARKKQGKKEKRKEGKKERRK